MKLAIVGSRSLIIENLDLYIPENTTEIVSGGAKGIDQCAERYALEYQLKLTVFKPEYQKYRRNAPLKRNESIVHYADEVLIFWDGSSRGTKFVIDACSKRAIPHCVVLL